jgi:hypothetical protein
VNELKIIMFCVIKENGNHNEIYKCILGVHEYRMCVVKCRLKPEKFRAASALVQAHKDRADHIRAFVDNDMPCRNQVQEVPVLLTIGCDAREKTCTEWCTFPLGANRNTTVFFVPSIKMFLANAGFSRAANAINIHNKAFCRITEFELNAHD